MSKIEYEKAYLEIVELKNTDIITTSGGNIEPGDEDYGWVKP